MSCARSFWPGSASSSGPVSAGAPKSVSSSVSRSAYARSAASTPATHETADMGETCDMCGMAQVEWRKCKLVCRNCGTILKSCADL